MGSRNKDTDFIHFNMIYKGKFRLLFFASVYKINFNILVNFFPE